MDGIYGSGTMNFEGVSLDACIDRKIEVCERDGSITPWRSTV